MTTDLRIIDALGFANLPQDEKLRILRDALTDVLDGNSQPSEIQYFTGLDDSRCAEISNLFHILMR